MRALFDSIHSLFDHLSPYCDKSSSQYDPQLHKAATDALTLLPLMGPEAAISPQPARRGGVLANGYCPPPIRPDQDGALEWSDIKDILVEHEYERLKAFCDSSTQHKAILEKFLAVYVKRLFDKQGMSSRGCVDLRASSDHRCPNNPARTCNCVGRCADEDS